jgi:hypothetical protein
VGEATGGPTKGRDGQRCAALAPHGVHVPNRVGALRRNSLRMGRGVDRSKHGSGSREGKRLTPRARSSHPVARVATVASVASVALATCSEARKDVRPVPLLPAGDLPKSAAPRPSLAGAVRADLWANLPLALGRLRVSGALPGERLHGQDAAVEP